MPRTDKIFPARFPVKIRAALKKRARYLRVSQNTFVVSAVEEALKK